MSEDYKKIAKTADVNPGEIKPYLVDDREIAIANVDGEFYAIDDLCTHADVNLSGGCVEGCEIECPAHFARFNLKTGEVTEPPAFEDIKTYEVKVEGEDILVKI